LTNSGMISGKVTEGENPVPGVLIVAVQTTGDDGFSSITDQNGEYVIYNIPANTYKVKGWISDYNSNEIDATITNGSETSNVDVTLTSGTSNTFTGQVRNLASENKDVDVALIHSITRETIPGLTTQSINQVYTISGIPDGIYLARATFENDERVMDPDRIAKFGEPTVDISGGITIDLQFDVTGAVTINNPTNGSDTNIPFEITGTNPTFEWTPYSSSSDYIIEVMESNGNVIWGGFDNSGNLPQKNIVIPAGQTSIEFNADGNASIPALEPGKVYRWRIFASKDDKTSDTDWTLISASEDQLGLIKVIE
ncbi:MAG: carboxypeptidase regulatory-like domain-containing protein, partial [Cyclobacteriaceae bacterium]|nr:carboxypeptidase regulatory-like domain-containing protein [Cyclobacteriaceae bacterium]